MNNNSVGLSVKDFQIIKSANLLFLPGLNCLIGQSNNGKSALMRAAKSCFYNTPGTTSVRLGCSNYAVGLQINGHTVILQKGTNSLYKIDGEVYGKIGRTQLEEVAKTTGVKELNINGNNEQINFWDQMEKPFLLDRSETELFRFIVDSGKDNNITQALKTITQDRQQITKDITITEGKIQVIEDTIKRQEEALKDSEKKISIYNKVVELGPKIKRVQEITALKNKALQEGQQLSTIILNKSKIDTLYNKTSSKLDDINTNIKKISLISNLISNINTNEKAIQQLKTQSTYFEQLEAYNFNERVNKYKILSDLISRTRDTQNEIQELNNKKVPEVSTKFDNNVKKYNLLSELLINVNNKKEQIKQLEEFLKNNKEELENINKEVNDIGICPTCGQPIHIN